MVLSQGAMTLSAFAWGMTAQIAGTRLTLFAAAFLFCVTSVVLMLLFKIPREQSGSRDQTKAFARLKGSSWTPADTRRSGRRKLSEISEAILLPS